MKIDESIKHIRRPITLIVMVFLGIAMTCQPVLSDEPVPIPESLYALSGEGTLNGVFKTLYFQRAFDGDTPDWATLAIGGNFNYETVPLHGVTAGIGFKTSQGNYLNSDDEVYRGILAEGATPKD
jgi:hypothetical protein